MTEKTILTTVPAHPGWEVVFLVKEKRNKDEIRSINPAHLECHPVIAWEIERTPVIGSDDKPHIHRTVIPVIVSHQWVDPMSNLWAMKRPDGKFEVRGEHTFENEPELIHYWKKQTRLADQLLYGPQEG